MKTIKVNDFNLQHTLDCGQFFRFRKEGEFFIVNAQDKLLRIKQEGDILHYDSNLGESAIKHLLGINEDYSRMLKSINKDKKIGEAIKRYHGLRLMNQDPWECLISFVCSSASNIPKIKRGIEGICREFGDKKSYAGMGYYSFPKPGEIDDIQKLKKTGVGFRARYIADINKIAEKRFFDELKHLDYVSAKEKLIKLPGVGEKVADCVLLFSLGHKEAFPVDVWVKRVMECLYFKGKETTHKKIIEFSQEYFGKYAGYAQQFLFHYWRNKCLVENTKRKK
jgi:N-glycosylase/DNA lyase